jgi:hypothetical protein
MFSTEFNAGLPTAWTNEKKKVWQYDLVFLIV